MENPTSTPRCPKHDLPMSDGSCDLCSQPDQVNNNRAKEIWWEFTHLNFLYLFLTAWLFISAPGFNLDRVMQYGRCMVMSPYRFVILAMSVTTFIIKTVYEPLGYFPADAIHISYAMLGLGMLSFSYLVYLSIGRNLVRFWVVLDSMAYIFGTAIMLRLLIPLLFLYTKEYNGALSPCLFQVLRDMPYCIYIAYALVKLFQFRKWEMGRLIFALMGAGILYALVLFATML